MQLKLGGVEGLARLQDPIFLLTLLTQSLSWCLPLAQGAPTWLVARPLCPRWLGYTTPIHIKALDIKPRFDNGGRLRKTVAGHGQCRPTRVTVCFFSFYCFALHKNNTMTMVD